MCLIAIYKPNAPRDGKEYLAAAHELNNDGIGVAYNLEKQLIIKRGFESFDSFFNYYSKIPAASSILVHFRKCSSGAVVDENLHPFSINENLCFAFNGTIIGLNIDQVKSDTNLFNTVYLQKLLEIDKNLYLKYCFRRLLEEYIRPGKMVMLDNLGNFIVCNDHLGFWDTEDKEKRKIWYSNNLWIKFKESKEKKKKYKKSENFVIKKPGESGVLTFQDGKFFQNGKLFTDEELDDDKVGGVKLGNPDEIKKKYYRIGDPYYLELSLDEIKKLSKTHNCGLKKLVKKKRVMGKIDNVPQNTLYEARLKHKNDFPDSTVTLQTNFVLVAAQQKVQSADEIAKNLIKIATDEIENKNLQKPPEKVVVDLISRPAQQNQPLTVSIGNILQFPSKISEIKKIVKNKNKIPKLSEK